MDAAVSPTIVAATLRAVLGQGTQDKHGHQITPFVFHVADHPDETFSARNAGLEGFVYSKREIETDLGPAAILHHLEEYFDYLDTLLSPAAGIAEVAALQEQLKELRGSNLSPKEKNARLGRVLGNAVSTLQTSLRAMSPSSWMRTARVYEIFPRAFNLGGWRSWRKQKFFADFTQKDFAGIKKDAVVIGISNRIEIWETASWREFFSKSSGDFEKTAEHMLDID